MSTPLPDPPRNTHWAKGQPNNQGLHGWLEQVRDRVEQVASDSGTSVSGSFATFADLPTPSQPGKSYVVRDEVALYVANDTGGYHGPFDVTGSATSAAVAAAVPTTPVKGAVLDVTKDAYADAITIDATKHSSLQAAVDAAQALAVPAIVRGGRTTYTLTAPVTVSASNVLLDLTSSRVVTNFAGQAIRFVGTGRLTNVGVRGGRINLSGTGVSGIVFTDCDDPSVTGTYIDNGTTNNGGGVTFNTCNRPTARDLTVRNTGGGIALNNSPWGTVAGCNIRDVQEVGILIYGQSNHCAVTGNLVHGYQLSGVSGGAIQVYGSDAVAVVGNTVKASASTLDRPKIRFRDASNFTCSGNVCEGSNGEGIQVVALGDIGTGAGRGTIVGNTVRDSLTIGINVSISAGGTAASLHPLAIVGNTVIGVRGTSTATGIAVNAGADAVVIASNLIDDIDGDGVTCGASASITGNMIRNVGRAIAGKSAIFIVGGTASLVGNVCMDDQATKTMAYGIWVHSGATSARLMGNVSTGHTAQAVRTGAGTGPNVTALVGESSAALVGFYGATPVARPSATADAASLRAALVTLGLINP